MQVHPDVAPQPGDIMAREHGTLAQISSRYFSEGSTITYDDLEFPEYDE